ncbi:cytochrome C assembly family protein [Marinobacterium lutimaris]|uniref:ABC-type uncharacterized transport system, permease component n=1 Tax=Marinobacterium lutimaris TaxID=568106 RepID=A0A1H6D6Y8_9GAMM|nr:cytochrome c biogenesis protein CcsA [Marinobacterium lutimaris]SEG80738.1 ABC-type uncharacterized transport system, permease component [Marinobacterium lutimaris]
MLSATTVIAMTVYMGAAWLQWQRLSTPTDNRGRLIRTLGSLAFVVHGYTVYSVLHVPDGIDLGTFRVGSLIAWVVVGILLASSLRQKLDNLFIGAFSMAAVTAGLAAFAPDTGDHRIYSGGLVIHILLSLLAYSIFTLAALHALVLSRQEKMLKQHHTRGLLNSLPPLQIMERLLFEMLWCGFILLSVALITGFFFVEDLFAQHIVHKTVLSIVAWLVYAVLLAGRLILGWRSQTAVRWTLGGFILLMLAFFGSKIVVEILLKG